MYDESSPTSACSQVSDSDGDKKEFYVAESQEASKSATVAEAALDYGGADHDPLPDTTGAAGSSVADPAANTSQHDEQKFSCRLASAKTLTNVLQCLNDSGQKDQLALCVISSDGLRVTVEDMGKCLQANVHFPPPLFDEFEFSEQNDCLEFRISLTLLLECLQIFGTANLGFTSVQMSCLIDEPETFNIILEEDGIVTECAISIQEGEESDIDYNATFRSSDELNKLIIKSDCLRDAFTELAETPGATSISVLISPTAPFFRLTADGSIGSCRIDFTKTAETFRHFQSDQEQEQRYKLTFLEMSLRGLSVAKETFLRMNEDGLLCVQHSVIEDGGHQFFMDFVLFPEDVEIE